MSELAQFVFTVFSVLWVVAGCLSVAYWWGRDLEKIKNEPDVGPFLYVVGSVIAVFIWPRLWVD